MDKEQIAQELKVAFRLTEVQAVKIVRRITGRVQFFQRAFELLAAKSAATRSPNGPSRNRGSFFNPHPTPYPSFYCPNIENLRMAGRNISVPHVALGTVRDMRAGRMMGEVVGMAASLCKRHNTDPRAVYQKHLDEFNELMRRGVGRGALLSN